MWGHSPGCGCPLCHSLRRVFALIVAGQGLQSFCNYALSAIRSFEAELRDELARSGITAGVAPPASAVGEVAPSQGPKAAAPQREQESSQPKEEVAEKKSVLNLTAKGAPAVPPPPLREAQPPIKPEAKEEVKEDNTARATSSGINRRRGSRSRRRGEAKSPSRKRSRRRGEGKSPSRNRSRRRERRSRDRDRKRRREEDTEEERPEGGKEKKRRFERPPEPLGPPPSRREDRHWVPTEPAYPPPVRQGSGWRGVLPVSDHARWTSSTNKGQVKRGKQELFNRRRDGRRRR